MNLCYDYQLNSHSLLIKDAHGSSIELDILSGEPNSLNNQNALYKIFQKEETKSQFQKVVVRNPLKKSWCHFNGIL